MLLLPVGPVFGHCYNFQFPSAAAAVAVAAAAVAAAVAAAEGSVPAFATAPGCFSGAGTVTVSQLSCSRMLRPLTVKYWQQSGSNRSPHAFRLRPILSTLNVFSLYFLQPALFLQSPLLLLASAPDTAWNSSAPLLPLLLVWVPAPLPPWSQHRHAHSLLFV